MFTKDMKQAFEKDGYVVVKGLFSPEETEFFRNYYTELRAKGSYPGDAAGVDIGSSDPLKRYPRMIHMHHWDEVSLRFLIDQRINEVLSGLLGQEPFAAQTMLYFKPAGARGQAMHQDNFFLRAHPGTCMAAWLALDRCDEENGCMRMVPGSQSWEILCTEKANTKESFTDVTVPLPEGTEVRSILMEPGDVLFFGGSLVHGSFPNTSANRFRRALIGHYVAGEARQVSHFMRPLLHMDGTEVDFSYVDAGGSCGVWVEEDGKPVIEMRGQEMVGSVTE